MPKELKYAFRIVHISNIPHVLQFGFLKPGSPNCSEEYEGIGDDQVISIRKATKAGDGVLNDCVPFYFGPRSPMLYVIQHGYNGVKRRFPEEIVYCVLRLDELIHSDLNLCFTDGHALNSLTQFYGKEDLFRVNELVHYDDVYAVNWQRSADGDLKRKKEAELLALDSVPPFYIKGFVVYNEEAKSILCGFGIANDKIVVAPNYYY